MKLKQILFLIIFLISGTGMVFSQGKTIEVTVMQVERGQTEGKPQSLMEVFGFYDLAKAQKFLKRLKSDIAFIPRTGTDYDCFAKTDVEGICELVLPNTGAIVVRPSFSEPVMQSVRGRLKILFKLEDRGKRMDEVITTARAIRTNKPRPGRRLGNRKIVGPIPFYLFREETRSDARMGLAPIVTVLENGDTFQIVRPFIKDGVNYQQTQKRRMGFDEKNDPLIAYRSKQPMQTREEDSVVVTLNLYPIDIKKHYRVTATKWLENYHNVYVTDSVCLDEGFDLEPMRFLQYDLIQTPIDQERYKREGRRELMNDSRKLNLKFMVGQAELDPTDSLNFLQLNQLKQDLARYVGDPDAGITSVEVHGQASPDGGIAINQRLCKERAEFLKSEISNAFPGLRQDMKASATVAGWEDVARLLEEDSLVAYATEVREIIASSKNTQVQERKIRALPYYDLIREQILPRLRVVDFTFYYFTNRVRTKEEVLHLYQTDPDYKTGKKQQPYEFYYLFDMVKDPKELEVLAKAALKSVKDEDYQKPWPLAAYILSQCYLKRDTFDTKLLEPYLDWNRAGMAVPELHKRTFEGSWAGWVNDEAIVTAYITNLCRAGDYFMADSVAVNLLPDVPRYDKMKRFLDCLNGMWNDPAVRDTVAASSIMNKVVVYAAQDEPYANNREFHEEALYLLQNDTAHFDPEDPKVLYMIATLRFRLEAENKTRKVYPETHFQFDDFFQPTEEDPSVDMYGDRRQDWGYPMIQCCLKDEKYMNYMLFDGEFNEQYRTAFKKVWKKLKENADGTNTDKEKTDETIQ